MIWLLESEKLMIKYKRVTEYFNESELQIWQEECSMDQKNMYLVCMPGSLPGNLKSR